MARLLLNLSAHHSTGGADEEEMKHAESSRPEDQPERKEVSMKRQMVSAVLILLVVATASAVAETRGPKGVVNINTASSDQLQLLPRVGPALAERIIDFRESNGPFKRVDEIVAVKGIGERSLEQLRPHLVVEGETTLKEKVSLPRTSSDGEKK